MKNLLIIGARGFGREVFSLAKRSLGYEEDFTIKGFLDDNAKALDGFDNYPPILGSVEDYKIEQNDVFICALGSVKPKKFYCEQILQKDGEFINLIEKNVLFTDNVNIGVGCIIGGPAIISNDVVIEDFVTIHANAVIGHDVHIGRFSHIGACCFFGGFSILDEEVTMYVNATILDRLKIGKGATVGACTLVIKNVKDGVTVFGNPSKVLSF